MTLLLTLLALAHPLPDASPGGCWPRPAAMADRGEARLQAALGQRTLEAAPLHDVPPRLDGSLEDAAWCQATPAGDFVESSPRPGKLASLPSVVRVLYDDEGIWVGIRLFDPRPDSIVAPLPRRDDETTSDWVFVEIDTRFDRRSGYSFGVNPRGVQVDGSWSDDVDYDPAWNGVWSAATRVDSLGWSAEFRIPYSQLALGRGTPGDPMPWGINVYRHVPHRGETSNWSPRLPSVVGVVSHFNDVEGLRVPPRHANVEVVPFTAVTASRRPPSDGAAVPTSTGELAIGGDVRLRPTAATALAVSVRPDFGQVEADPAEVNLTTFETFLPERRPLFLEGGDLFHFPAALDFSSRAASFAEERLFYSRRIGGPPHGAAAGGDAAGTTPLQVAARFSGRAGSWSGGAFQAWTGPVRSHALGPSGDPTRVAVEPLTSYTTARAVREMDGGSAAVGGMATLVHRAGMDAPLDSLLGRDALVVGTDGRGRFGGDRWELTGFVMASRVAGSVAAIRTLRSQPRHGYGRPGDVGEPPVDADSLARSLSGLSAQARLARVEGDLRWGAAARVVTRGFEANDGGFQENADWLLTTLFWRYRDYRPGHKVRRWSIGSNQLAWARTLSGLRRAATVDLELDADLSTFWGGSVGFRRELPAFDTQVLRGGPALLLPARDMLSLNAYTDSRRRWQVTVSGDAMREKASGSSGWSVRPGFSGFLTDRLQVGVSPSFADAREGWQYVDQPVDAAGRAHWIMGRLHQETGSLTTRLMYAFSPRLTLQLYAQAFVSSGAFASFSEVVDPDARAPGARVREVEAARLQRSGIGYLVDPGSPGELSFADPDFSERDLRVNAVLRWEFRPGSTVYAVWTQARRDVSVRPWDLASDVRRLSRAPAYNAVEVKVSWWLAP